MTSDFVARSGSVGLRHWRPSDMEPFAEMCGDPEVMKFFPSTMSHAQCSEFIERVNSGFVRDGYGLWAVEVDGRFAGYTGLSHADDLATFTPCVEVGWRFAAWAWGRGHATVAAREAIKMGFIDHGLERIYSWTTTTNARSEAVMQRIGMTRRTDLDFDHPRTPGWWGQRHIVYLLERHQWRDYGG